MFKKYLSLVLVLLITLGLFSACGSKSPAEADKNGAGISEDTDSAENATEELLSEAEIIANSVVEATMHYDLAIIKEHSVLDSEDCEKILYNILAEVINEDGEYEWDGIYCGPAYDDFVKVYDEYNAREYEKLEITLTDSALYSDTDVLTDADERELLYRDEDGITAYYEAVSNLDIENVAVFNYKIVFKDENTTDPMTGEPVVYEEKTVTMTVYMVLINGQWKSYSPTIAGTFPPLSHFPRYTVEV